MHSPTLFYLHRLIAYLFSGRKDSPSIISKTELFFLRCMVEKKRVNLGCFIASQLNIVIIHHRLLILRHIVTQIALHERVINLESIDLHKACDSLPLDLMSLDDVGLLCKVESIILFVLQVLPSLNIIMCSRRTPPVLHLMLLLHCL